MAKAKTEINEAIDLLDVAVDDINDSIASEYVSTGFPQLDFDILKRGGLPTKRIIEIFGADGVGKSMLILRIIGQWQKKYPDRKVLLMDTEYNFDPDWARMNGVDTSRLTLIQTNIAEDVFDKGIIPAVNRGDFSLIVLDSLGNLEVDQYFNGKRFERDSKTNEVKTDKIAAIASVLTKAIKVIPGPLTRNDCTFIFANQVRDSLNAYGSQVNTPGGRCVKHNRSISLELSRVGDIKVGENVEGMIVKARLRKSKQSAPTATNESNHLKFFFEGGAEKADAHSTYNLAISTGLFVKRGAWVRWIGTERKWQGIEKVIDDLLADADLLQKVKNALDVQKESTVEPYESDDYENADGVE